MVTAEGSEASTDAKAVPRPIVDYTIPVLRRRLEWLVGQRYWMLPLYAALEIATSLLVRRTLPLANLTIAFAVLLANAAYGFALRNASTRSTVVLAYLQPSVDILATLLMIWFDTEPLDATAYGLFVALVTCSLVIERAREITITGLAATTLLMAADFARVNPAQRWQWAVATAATGATALAVGLLNVRRFRADEATRRADARLIAMKEESAHRDRLAALGELSAVVAHEVRNPVGVIFNSVSALRRRVGDDADAIALLEIVQEEAERINRTIGEMLDLTRSTPVHFVPTQLWRVIEQSVRGALADADARRIRVLVDVPTKSAPVLIDEALLVRVLANILENAKYALPDGGVIAVSADVSGRKSRRVRFEIRDDGIGMKPDVLARVCDPFFTTRAKGTGLGMAITKRIVERLHGTLSISSVEGQGTKVLLEFPLREVQGDRLSS